MYTLLQPLRVAVQKLFSAHHAFRRSLSLVGTLMLCLLATTSPGKTTGSANAGLGACPEIQLPADGILPATPAGSPMSAFITASPAGSYQYTVTEVYGNSFVQGNYSLHVTTGELNVVAAKGDLAGQEGYIIIRAIDANGCFAEQRYTFTAQCAVITFPDTIPTLIAQVPISFSVAAASPGNYTYSVYYSNLPYGLSLDASTGIISGKPDYYYNDSNDFTILATNENSCVATKEYYFYVETRPDTIPFPDSLPTGQVGKAYYTLINPGDKYGYHYDPFNTAPAGLDFNEVGEVKGIPTKAGTYQLKALARSWNGYREAMITFTLVIEEGNCPAVSLPEQASIPVITVRQPYSASFAVSPAGTYTYSYYHGSYPNDLSLPEGLTFNTTTGELSGTTIRGAYFNVTIQATDTNGCITTKTYEMTSICPLTFPAIPNGKVGVYYSADLTPSGDLAPYAYAIDSYDSLPPGLTLNTSTGQIAGIPTTAGSFFFTIQLTNPCYISKAYTITIAPTTTCHATGYILRETWVKVKGYPISTIPVNTPPTATRQLTRFEGPSNVTNEYGDRIRGYICPPASGNYTFWIASDDYSDLYLSSNDQPSNKKRIAWVKGATQPRQWDKYGSQQSVVVYLEEGKKYYIETLHKEAYGDDHLAVGWQLPDGTLQRPIPDKQLSPFVPSARLANLAEESIQEEMASAASLSAAPNPFSDQTTIRFTAQAPGQASVMLYDMNGSLVKILFRGDLEEGKIKELTLAGAALPSGIYLVKGTSKAGVSHLKLVLTH